VEYEDRVTIATPEGVELDLALAGVGSRFVAAFVDLLLQTVLIIALGLAFVGLDVFGDVGTGLGAAAFAICSFVVVFGYHTFFEVLAAGRSPGKRWTGLRVVRIGGHPITFTASAVRNLVRAVDFLPGYYVVGAIAILVTSRNQRLGDVAAGTIVVRERRPPPPTWRPAAMQTTDPRGVDSWDVSAVTAEELATVRSFLDRRHEVTNAARAQLGDELAARLRPKVAGFPPEIHAEAFLEGVVAAKASRH
jgi:uncharacterized RDD family membrane protein YckC